MFFMKDKQILQPLIAVLIGAILLMNNWYSLYHIKNWCFQEEGFE